AVPGRPRGAHGRGALAMPRAILDRGRLLAVAGKSLDEATLDDLLFASKAEVEGHEDGALTISVTPDRLDLLSEGGLGLYLQGVLEISRGIPSYRAGSAEDLSSGFEVDPSVEPLRPAIVGAVVRAPAGRSLDVGLLAEAVRFVPLDASEEVGAVEFFREHPLAQTYGPLGRQGDSCLTLRDARGAVLSLPPVLNGRAAGEARVGDRELLIEATGTRERSVVEAVGLLLVVFVAQGWSVAPVPVTGQGRTRSDGNSLVQAHSLDLPSSLVRSLGGAGLSAAVVERRLAQSRLTGHPHSGGWKV